MAPPRDLGRIPGPIVIANVIEVDLIWNLPSGKQVKNVLHAQVAPGFNATAAVAQAIYAAIIGSASWTAWAAYLSNQGSLAGVQLRDIRAANNPFVASTGAATAGTSVSAALPPGASVTITLRTQFAGRGFRGRVYLPGIASNAVVTASGAILAAANTAAANFVTAVQTALTASSATLAVAQPARQAYIGRTNRNIPQRLAGVNQVTSIVARLTAFTSQRRRSLVA